MPVGGRKPKPKGEAVTRHKQTYEWVEVPDVPFKGAPALSAKLPDGRVWPARTKAWWKTISSMPHCALWTPADWQFAIDTALVAAAFHAGDVRLDSRLLAREKVLGTTLDFRRDLRIRYINPAEPREIPAEVADIDAYRDRIG